MSNEQKPLILAVDDEATNLQVLRQTLAAEYRLKFAKSGELALSLSPKSAPT